MADLVFPELPPVGPLLARGVAGSIRAGSAAASAIPERAAIVAAHRQDVGRLARYARVCGFTLRDRVPPTWLHVLTFPLQVALMAERDFPYRLAGLVHTANEMVLHRPVSVGDELALVVRAGNARAHRRGVLVDLVGEVRVGADVAWRGTSTYLAPGASSPGVPAPPPREDEGEGGAGLPRSQQWRLPADLGRRYAAVSGDVNPIHLSAVAARLLGYRRPIAHGMWLHARALAALEPRLPDAYAIGVRFTRPVLLPGSVGFGTDGSSFAVSTRDGKPHLTGRVAA